MRTGQSDHGKEPHGRLSQRTPLLFAAQSPHLGVLELLISRGADIHARNNSGETALHLAAWYGHASVVQVMLEAGSNIEAKDKWCGETPLFKAAANGHTAIVIFLLQRGARVDHINYLGRNVLQHCQLATSSNEDTTRILLKHIGSRPVITGM